ncbi:uncharacterized protein LOC114351191 [Ostrinia furnacalis]|uniref:uncharacterized protein LOC114351191 n=1 Tax=Ostrinia furnacalis TaxID=93504 RepID=UPI00103EBD8A|nr:uncharacterized protein LOC114351191 [Ostrinia furnacalis]
MTSLNHIFTKYSVNNSECSVYYYTFDSPLGDITAVADDSYLYMVCFEDSKNNESTIKSISKKLSCSFVEEKNEVLIKFEEELAAYLDGKLKKFTVPLKMIGTDFQKDVWKKLLKMPYGSTQTYGDLAKSLGRSASSSRAIGAACGANPHLLVVPCHRLVASNAKGGGFSSGVDRKEWLLNHEKKNNS